MSNLEKYRRCVNEIRKYATENGISLSETDKIFEECLTSLEKKSKKNNCIVKTFDVIKYCFVISSIFFLSFIILYNHDATHKLVLRNLQDYIHPGLKILRNVAIPIIKQYPSLTEWYDEWCLVENPYFRVAEMECWPCSMVHSIPDLTGRNISFPLNIGMPYTKKDNDYLTGMDDLIQMYKKNSTVFNEDAKRISTNDPSYKNIKDVFGKKLHEYPRLKGDLHVSWRITRMKPGRLIRKLFPRPNDVPKIWSQSTEKYIFIDEPHSQIYVLPNPECSNVILKCTKGSRLINLVPSPECLQNCKSFTILLSAGHTLWYNWWYWRPRSIPAVNSTEISINYLTSFC